VIGGWDGSGSGESTPSLSSMGDDDDDDLDGTISSLDSDIGFGDGSPRRNVRSLDVDGTSAGPGQRRKERMYEHRKDVEEMQARQYWRAEWRIDVSLSRPFALGDASTLGKHQV
jgi:gamma-tubulin complex component 5